MVSAYNALLLLRASFSAPKLMHTLRSPPCTDNHMLDKFDSLVRKDKCMISNTELSDIQWIQASLPDRNGCLGIGRVASLATSAFLASAAGTSDLQGKILAKDHPLTESAVDVVLACWTSRHNSGNPEGPDSAIQRVWDRPIIVADITMPKISMPERHN